METKTKCARCKRNFNPDKQEDYCILFELCNKCNLYVMENGHGPENDY